MKPVKIALFIAILVGSSFAVLSHPAMNEGEDLGEAIALSQIYSAAAGGKSFLGVSLDEVDSELARKLGLGEEYGAHIKEVIEGSPAEKAGLKKDDVIVEWNGSRVESSAQLQRLVRETPAGRKVRLGVIRDGKRTTFDVTLEKRSAPPFDLENLKPLKEHESKLLDHEGDLHDFYFQMGDLGKRIAKDLKLNELGDYIGQSIFICGGKGRMGVTIESLTPQLAEYFGLKDRTGVLVTSVRKDSPAEKAGLKAGDVIVSIEGKKVEDTGDVITSVEDKEEGTLTVNVIRDKQEKTFKVTLQKEEMFEKEPPESFKHPVKIEKLRLDESTEL